MSTQFNKNGCVNSGNVYESDGTNILENAQKYTKENPYVWSSAAKDGNVTTNMYCPVTAGKTYYLSCQCDREWGSSHSTTASMQKATIWLYLYKVYNPGNYGYDNPILFTTVSSGYLGKGLWKYTIPSGYTMARVRFNSYSDGSIVLTTKFWDIELIPAEYYVTPPHNSSYWSRLCIIKGDCGILSHCRKVVI